MGFGLNFIILNAEFLGFCENKFDIFIKNVEI